MSKLIALAALAAALLVPGAAHAATATKLQGVVVAREGARHVLVLAGAHGTVTSARVTAAQLRATRVGARVSVAGTKLPDGSLRTSRLQRSGLAKQARLRVTVLKVHRSELLVAGGGSSFAIGLAGSSSHFHPGEQITTQVKLGKSGPVGNSAHDDGQSALIDFSGQITALDATSLTISSDGVTTVVQIPDGVTLPSLVQVGKEVEIVASISGSTLTLVEIKLDGDSGSGDGGSHVNGDSRVEVHGFVTALDASSITIQPGDNASPVTFAIPAGFTLPSGIAAGSPVEAKGEVANGVLTLTRIELNNDGGDGGGQNEIRTQGTVTALDAGSLTVQPSDSGTPLTFSIPDGFTLPSGLQVGSIVDARGEMVNGVLTLTKLELQSENDGQVEAEGSVTALDSGSVTIQTEDSSTPVTFAIPDGFTLPSGLQVGSDVKAEGSFVNGVLTLSRIELQDSNGGGGGGGEGDG